MQYNSVGVASRNVADAGGAGMGKAAKFGKGGKGKRNLKVRLPKSGQSGGRDIIRQDERFRIAPKHPGMGRR
jgi:hypothetical protein